MSRAPNKKAKEAQALYQQGKKLAEIAQQLGVPAGTVRRWKCVYGWESEQPCKKVSAPKKNDANAPEETNAHITPPTQKRPPREQEVPLEVELVMQANGLNHRQRLFCLYYVKTFNATQSYLRAYECGYTTAATNGPGMLKNPKIAWEIRKIKQARYAKAFLEPGDIFQKYLDIAFADITEFVSFGQEEQPVMGADGPVMVEDPKTRELVPLTRRVNLVRSRPSEEVDGTILTEISQGKDGFKIKLADRMKALQWLADHMDLPTEEQNARLEKLRAETKKLKGEDNELEDTAAIMEEVDKDEQDNDTTSEMVNEA